MTDPDGLEGITRESFRLFYPGELSEADLESLGRAFVHIARARGTIEASADEAYRLLSDVFGFGGFRYGRTFSVGNLPSNSERQHQVDKAIIAANGHNALVERSSELFLNFGEVGLRIRYVPEDKGWNLGAVHVEFTYPEKPTGGYTLRGLPWLDDETLGFDIHSLQARVNLRGPWVRVESYRKGDLTPFNNFSDSRRALCDYMRQGKPKKVRITREDMMLLIGLSYLQKYGVTSIRGTAHKDQQSLGDEPGKGQFNYDELFSRWMLPINRTDFMSWAVDVTQPSFYMREDVPRSGLKDVLERVYDPST